MALIDKLRDEIASSGPLPFDDFMRASLYDDEFGFFATGPLRSVKSGDFLTSPEVSPWFGMTLGRYVADELLRIGGEGAVVADIGAGSGSLLEPRLLAEVGGTAVPWAVDASPAARAALSEREGWNVASASDGLPDRLHGVVVANELLDNLPSALAVFADGTWTERSVADDGEGGLALVESPARLEVLEWCERYGGTVPEGGMVEVQLEAFDWVVDMVQRLSAGSVVLIDYGGTAEELEPRRTRGTLRTYRAHHLGPDPLLEPGATDLTADVNFTAAVAAAEQAGASVELHRQDDFLRNWGLGDEIAGLRREELELARTGDALARLRARSERTEAETLLHPRGLGDFRVLIARK